MEGRGGDSRVCYETAPPRTFRLKRLKWFLTAYPLPPGLQLANLSEAAASSISRPLEEDPRIEEEDRWL